MNRERRLRRRAHRRRRLEERTGRSGGEDPDSVLLVNVTAGLRELNPAYMPVRPNVI